jgi:hydroxyacyl-ACP dehydratase HTD2-like protein with hotdog domain
LRSNFSEETIKAFEFRALGPIFGDHRFSVHGTRPNPDGNVTLWIANHDSQLCMQGTANIER